MAKNPRKKTLIWLIGTQVPYAFALLYWPRAFNRTMMLFQDAFSWEDFGFGAPIWIFPLIAIGCSLAAWWFFKRNEFRRAHFMTILPLPFALIMFSMISLVGFNLT